MSVYKLVNVDIAPQINPNFSKKLPPRFKKIIK